MKLSQFPKIAVPLGVVGILLVLLLPIPAPVLDVLIVVNIILALVILLTTMFVRKPLDFSVFPSLLLVATLFRLGLNVASTRLVLGQGDAGAVIHAFGSVAVSGSVIIGAVVFAILVVIQFVVVTKGAERVAEVGARFTLDAMPGKQMAIDADLNAGLLTDAEARKRRADVAAEADFYGAMDGGSKFVKGDAIAGIVIILINVVGGIAIGMLQRGMDIGEAVNTYTLLSIGDGLTAQIPALLLAVSTGMIVTRANADEDMGSTASKQLAQSRVALMIGGCAALVMGLIPGMPILAFAAVGLTLIFVSQRIKATQARQAADAERAEKLEAPTRPETTDEIIEKMKVDLIEIGLAPDLIDVVNGGSDDLIARVRSLRKKIALDFGFVIPAVRTHDSVGLPAATYSIRISGVEAASGRAPSGKVLAIGDAALAALPGEPTTEPVYGLPAKWIPAETRRSAELAGATVIDRISVIVTHLNDVLIKNAPRLLTREDVRVLTASVKQRNAAAVEELTPSPLALADIQRVLQGLLAERVAINDLDRIYEGLGVKAKTTQDVEQLIEAARAALGPALVAPYIEEGTLRLITIDPLVEQSMLERQRPSDSGTQIILDTPSFQAITSSCRDALARAEQTGHPVAVVCAPQIRPALRRLLLPLGATVLSYDEVTHPDVAIETMGVIRDEHAPAAV